MKSQISFVPDIDKIKQSIFYIMGRGEARPYHIMKILFEADKFHINNYGRPVAGASIMAEAHGTTPRQARDIVAEMWGVGTDFFNNNNSLDSKESPDMSYLSGSDKKALDVGFDKYGKKTTEEVERLNHRESAWIKALENNLDEIPAEYFLEGGENSVFYPRLASFGKNIVF
ncbi:MAG: SocA family protein [Rickettsiales bacterium]|jgi:hypothetical protein|nr:SocA family protein [Rickettsiales bacterium]